MEVMKYIQLFESFSNNDGEVIKAILSVSDEDWFKTGDDPPESLVDKFDDYKSDNRNIEHAIKVTFGGPGYTDLWVEFNELISDVLDENPDMTEEDIQDSNQQWFETERAKLPYLKADWWNSELARDLAGTIRLLAPSWSIMPDKIKMGIKIPPGYEDRLELRSEFSDLGLF